jgi:hypothetical protein
MKNKSGGFHLIIIVIIVVALGVASGAGYLVYKKINRDKEAQSSIEYENYVKRTSEKRSCTTEELNRGYYTNTLSDGSKYCVRYPAADKPVIYLYPTTEQFVKVQLEFNGTLTSTYPTYDWGIKGWEVIASPDGLLINKADNQAYSYLFWEGVPSSPNYDLTTGFVVRGEDTKNFLQTTLSALGLTPKEYNEMIVYWLPKMQNNPYNLIHFAGNDYTDNAKLTITPKPDSLLRVFMVYKPLERYQKITPQPLPHFERQGFTAVEWGGTELL